MPRVQSLKSFGAVYWNVLEKVRDKRTYLARFQTEKARNQARNRFYTLKKSAEELGDESQVALVRDLRISIGCDDEGYWLRLKTDKKEDELKVLVEVLEDGLTANPTQQDDDFAMLDSYFDQMEKGLTK